MILMKCVIVKSLSEIWQLVPLLVGRDASFNCIMAHTHTNRHAHTQMTSF